jgi:hypothetical protein
VTGPTPANGDATGPPWPRLTLSEWEDTRDALHLWTQIVGKVRLALAPMVNHWWQVALYVSARGLTTSLMPVGTRGLEIQFDFVDHRLHVLTTDGGARHLALRPISVAEFHAETMEALRTLGVRVPMLPRPVEVAESVPFAQDTRIRQYDPEAGRRFWLALIQAARVMATFRGGFVGKASPVHFFWGAPDLAVSRFSGRRAPKHPGGVPHCADWVQELAYSHEVSSCGFWPGGSEEGSFYSYAYPEPDGFRDWPVQPAGASYDHELGEFVLPYATVRAADDPDETLLSFFQSTYDAAAELGGWDRAALEAEPPAGRAAH